jgi:hypothetical protein
MAYWIVLTVLCCSVGFWLATKYNLDSKVGISLGLAFSILFSTGLYAEFRKYDPSLKLMLVVFVVLLCLTFLLLLERRTLVAWLKLASLTFAVSVLSHQVVPNPAYLVKAQSALNYFSEATGIEAADLRTVIASAENRADALAKSLSEGPNTLVEVRRETELLNADGNVSRRVGAGTWALLSGDTLPDSEKRFTEVEILDEQGQVTQVGYLDESDIGLKVILPPDELE